jgi:hypothetical protein
VVEEAIDERRRTSRGLDERHVTHAVLDVQTRPVQMRPCGDMVDHGHVTVAVADDHE